jgi:hypothetical protein
MNPYILMPQQQQDVSGLQPVYQNIAAQQLMHDQALAQQNQQVQQAGQKPSGGGGMNPMALAQMLRKPQTAAPVTDYSQPMPQYLDPAYMQAGY